VISGFFVNTSDGRIATRAQLGGAGLLDDEEKPVEPWHPIQGPRDASTMWYAVLRKRERGVYIAMLCFRHGQRLPSLESKGWREVSVGEIGV
jgi:hypothetical protein